MSHGLEMKDGMIVTRPVLGWTIGPVANSAVIVKLQYAESPEHMAAGGSSIQVILTPLQAQELAAELTRSAQVVLRAPSAGSA